MKKIVALIALFLLPAFAAIPGSRATLVSSLSTTLTRIAATGSNLSGYNISNPNAATVYVQIFDAAATGDVTLGSTTPNLSIAVPAFGVTDALPSSGVAFQNGIVIAATTTATGSSAPSTALVANFFTQ